jgi:hypothetical protein
MTLSFGFSNFMTMMLVGMRCLIHVSSVILKVLSGEECTYILQRRKLDAVVSFDSSWMLLCAFLIMF